MNTLLLDQNAWDFVLDAGGNIAMASDPYSIAQDCASAVRLFSGELWYDTTQGVPYWQHILGKSPSIQYMKSQFISAASTVPEVVSVACFIQGITNRGLTGQLQITDTSGAMTAVGF